MATSIFTNVRDGAAALVYRDVVHLRTEESTQFIDLTELVEERVRRSGIGLGTVVVQSRHTTSAVVVQEDEPHLLEDLRDLLERWAPARARYHHNDRAVRPAASEEERPNGHAHARALLLGTSVCLTVTGGRLDLGRWQRVLLVELDGPRPRSIAVQVVGVAGEGRS